MNVVFNGLTGCFFRSLEQRSHIHVEADIGIACGHYFSATIVPVLSDLAPPFEEVEIAGEAPDTPKVRDALMRVIETFARGATIRAPPLRGVTS